VINSFKVADEQTKKPILVSCNKSENPGTKMSIREEIASILPEFRFLVNPHILQKSNISTSVKNT
jgi:hypothetical protein